MTGAAPEFGASDEAHVGGAELDPPKKTKKGRKPAKAPPAEPLPIADRLPTADLRRLSAAAVLAASSAGPAARPGPGPTDVGPTAPPTEVPELEPAHPTETDLPLSRFIRAVWIPWSAQRWSALGVALSAVPLLFGGVCALAIVRAIDLSAPIAPGPVVALCYGSAALLVGVGLTAFQLRHSDPSGERWSTVRWFLGLSLLVAAVAMPFALGVPVERPSRHLIAGEGLLTTVAALCWFFQVRLEARFDRSLGHRTVHFDGAISAALSITAVMGVLGFVLVGYVFGAAGSPRRAFDAYALGAAAADASEVRVMEEEESKPPAPCDLVAATAGVPEPVANHLLRAHLDLVAEFTRTFEGEPDAAVTSFAEIFGCPERAEDLGNGTWGQHYTTRAAMLIGSPIGAGAVPMAFVEMLGRLGTGSLSLAALIGQVTLVFPCGVGTKAAGVVEPDGDLLMLLFQRSDEDVLAMPTGVMDEFSNYVTLGQVPIPTAPPEPLGGDEVTQQVALPAAPMTTTVTGPFSEDRFADPDLVREGFTISDVYRACNPEVVDLPPSLAFER